MCNPAEFADQALSIFLRKIRRPDMQVGRNCLNTQVSWLVLIFGMVLTMVIGARIQHDVNTAAVRQFAYASDQITIKVRERLEDQERLLHGAAAFMTASDLVTREDWRL